MNLEGSAYFYQCNNGLGFAAKGTEESITIKLADGDHVLKPVAVETGFHFSDGTRTLQGKNDQAYFHDGQQRFMCQIDRRASFWEDARARGADFVALGNEPAWKLELSRTGDMLYIGNYGMSSFRIATPTPSHANKSPLVFAAKNAEHSLWLSIEDKPCTDTMKGNSFDVTVSLVVDDHHLSGCGMILNSLYP